MALELPQQILEQIKKSSQILITFKQDFSGDALASALAMQKILQKMDKRTDIVCSNFKTPKNLNWLPTENIGQTLVNLRKFTITLNTSQTKVGEFSYDNQENKLHIFITPQNGDFVPEDISTSTSSFKYDLIITLNTPDLESLGEIFSRQTELFYKTPIINFDNLATNENYGQINLIDLTCSSTSEVLYYFLKEAAGNFIDEDIATYLLLGIITTTKNFKTPNITPHCLNAASQLIDLGARREQIIQNLYQSRFINTLKLWGRILLRLKSDHGDKIAWATLTRNDFADTATGEDDLNDVIDELIANLPKVEIIALLYESAQGEIKALVYAVKNLNACQLLQKYSPIGGADVANIIMATKDLTSAEQELIAEIKSKLEKMGI